MQELLLYENCCDNRLVAEAKYSSDDIIRTQLVPVTNKVLLPSPDLDSL